MSYLSLSSKEAFKEQLRSLYSTIDDHLTSAQVTWSHVAHGELSNYNERSEP